MKDKYDVIVIGAGNGGLMAALNIASKGKSVLVLESNYISGGLATSFVKGRFEFENTLRCINSLGSETNKGRLRKLFDEFNLNDDIEWIKLPNAYKIIKTDNPREEYDVVFGADEFIKKMQEYEPESKDKLSEFFELAKEVHDGFLYTISTPNIDYDYIKSKFPNYMNTASYTVDEVFKKLKLPKKIEDIIKSYWICFGVSTLNMNFAHYIYLFYEFITNEGYIPKNRSMEISLAIEKKIRDYGGKVWFNDKVCKILVENNNVTGVVTESGKTYYTNHIICNTSLLNIYEDLIDKDKLDKKVLKLLNSRRLGAKALTIYLGLNKSPEDLGITNYTYIIYNSLDSNTEIEKMKSIDSNTIIVTCLNKANEEASIKGTTILNITAFYYADCFKDIFNEENYYKVKENIANKLIERFEFVNGINIKDFIEEIEISTPCTYSLYDNSYDGCVYGWSLINSDSVLSRITNKDEDVIVNGLRLCGAYSYYGHGYDNTYINSYEVSKKTLSDIDKGDVNNEGN